MIHFGCALEFNKALLVAEALAAACVHDDWPPSFLFPVEKHMQANPEIPSKPMLEIMDELYRDPIIKSAVQMSDPLNKISDGLLAKVCNEVIPYLAQYRVQLTADDLQKQTIDMIHTCTYMIGAAKYPGKVAALDFVLLHTLTLSTFYPTFMAQDWITNENKARLLHFKVLGDMVMYAGCGCPTLYGERITKYVPKRLSHGWKELTHCACVYGDDGHTSSIIRGLLHTQSLPDPPPGFPLHKHDFVNIAHMALDSANIILEPGQYKVTDEIQKTVAKEMGQDEEIVRVIIR